MTAMEAIAGASRGGIAGCSYTYRDAFAPSASKNGNLVLPGSNYYASSRRGSLRMVRQTRVSSVALQDQTHVHYYLSTQHRARKDRLMNTVLPKAIAGVGEAVVEEGIRDKEVRKAKKIEMKMEKRRMKSARDSGDQSSSSSSSSSSESEAGETMERRTRKKRVNSENLRREWASISQSPLMNSIPTISSSFVIEQPSATAQQFASPGASSIAAQQAETHVRRHPHRREISRRNDDDQRQPLMADATVPRSASAGTAHLEVCMGGKCKKAGAEEVLSAFNANGVNASACNKCMKKCKLAVNVLVHPDGDDVPQMFSSIGVQDVNALSRKYLGAETASREAIEV